MGRAFRGRKFEQKKKKKTFLAVCMGTRLANGQGNIGAAAADPNQKKVTVFPRHRWWGMGCTKFLDHVFGSGPRRCPVAMGLTQYAPGGGTPAPKANVTVRQVVCIQDPSKKSAVILVLDAPGP